MKINEVNSTVVDNIEQISYNDPSGWYVSGGCYEFAMALKLAMPSSTIITADDAEGTDVHAFVNHENKYYDINGEHTSPDDVIRDSDITYTPPIAYHNASFTDLSQYTMQVDLDNVKALAQDLRG